MSKKKISKNKHTGEKAVQKKFWERKPVKIFFTVLLPVVIIVVAILIFNLLSEKNPAKPGSENVTSENITISKVSISEITQTSITATWTTNVPATGELHATMVGNNTTFSSFQDKTLSLEHVATVNDLSPSIAYKLRVISVDAAGKKAEAEIEQPYTTLEPRTAIGISVGERSPDFSLTSTTGNKVSSADFAGKRMLICFWELSCNSCKAELPYINGFYNNLADEDIEVLTISVRGDANLVRSYLDSQKFSLPVLLDPDAEVAGKFTFGSYPSGYPMGFLIDSDGKIAKIKEGAFRSTAEIKEFVE